MEPYEVVAQPFVLYTAPVGTAFPDINSSPAVAWTKVGTSGDLNYTEDGVTVSLSQSIELWRALGSTGPRKGFRTEEEMRISMVLADLTLEQLAHALNGNTVTTVAPTGEVGGYKKIGLSRGITLQQRALLVRGAGASAYGDSYNAQFEVPVVVQGGEPELVFTKGEPAGVALEFIALEDPDASSTDERFGRLVMQNQDPTS